MIQKPLKNEIDKCNSKVLTSADKTIDLQFELFFQLRKTNQLTQLTSNWV